MIEKEEIKVKLKADIVILKNQIEVNCQKFDSKLQSEQEKYQKDLQ